MRNTLSVLSILLIIFSCSTDYATTNEDKPSEQKTLDFTIDGRSRVFIIYLPKGYNNATKISVIFIIHGGSGTPQGMMNIADFKPIADRAKIVLV